MEIANYGYNKLFKGIDLHIIKGILLTFEHLPIELSQIEDIDIDGKSLKLSDIEPILDIHEYYLRGSLFFERLGLKDIGITDNEIEEMIKQPDFPYCELKKEQNHMKKTKYGYKRLSDKLRGILILCVCLKIAMQLGGCV